MLNTNASSDNGRPILQLAPLSIGGSTDNGLSRSGNNIHLDGKNSGPTSASSSSYSALSFATGGLRHPAGTPDPSSAISSVYSDRENGVSMERDNSVNGLLPDLDKLSLDKGRPLDVEDLDDDGWLAASEQKKIDELGGLGEGAGGAVTRCKLRGANTVFALKVSFCFFHPPYQKLISRSSLRIQTPT
jgi:mitogen-activated protein kinase kinase